MKKSILLASCLILGASAYAQQPSVEKPQSQPTTVASETGNDAHVKTAATRGKSTPIIARSVPASGTTAAPKPVDATNGQKLRPLSDSLKPAQPQVPATVKE